MSTRTSELAERIATLGLVDHHVHGALGTQPEDLDDFARHIAETDRPAAAGTDWFDSQLGFAIRAWCAPVLDLPVHTPARAYLERRAELGAAEVNRRFLTGTGIDTYLLETGYRGEEILAPAPVAAASGAEVAEVVRLETLAESVAQAGTTAAGFADAFTATLQERTRRAVGLKTIVAYRHGLDFDPERPTSAEVTAAAGRWLAEIDRSGQARLDDPVLLRFVIWSGLDRGLPLQIHTGFGDPDLDLHRANPLLLTAFIRASEPLGVPLMLLHCYPYHREAGYLARAFPHVYFDVGLGVNYLGVRAPALVAESLELAPFGKQLFSTDAWGPAELHFLGATLWRRAMSGVMTQWVEDGACSAEDAVRVAAMIGAGNAQRVYALKQAP